MQIFIFFLMFFGTICNAINAKDATSTVEKVMWSIGTLVCLVAYSLTCKTLFHV